MIKDLLPSVSNRVNFISPESTVADAIRLMTQVDQSAIMVKQGKRLVGIFSERDVISKLTLQQRNPETTLVKDIMSTAVIHVTGDHSCEEAIQVMSENQCRHLPVFEGEEIVAFLTIVDVATAFLENGQLHIRPYNEMSWGSDNWPF